MKSILIVLLFFGFSAHATGLDYLKNGITTPVKVDTATPANSNPYPFAYYDSTGARVDLGTDSSLSTINTSVLGINTTLQGIDFATETTLVAAKADLDTLAAIDFATSANQTTANGYLSSIDTKTPALVSGSVPVHVDNFPTTQPVSGTVAVTQSTSPWVVDGSGVTQPISAVSLPLPTGAATETSLLGVKTDIEALSAQFPVSLGQTTKSGSLSVTVASDQDALATKSPVNASGSYAEITNLTTTAQTFTAPSNAVGFVIEALSDNTNNIRYKIGSTATTTSGMRLEPGRSENYNSGPAANISVIAEDGTNQIVTVQWILSQ